MDNETYNQIMRTDENDGTILRTRRAAVIVYAEVDESISDLDADRVLVRLIAEGISARAGDDYRGVLERNHVVSKEGIAWTVRVANIDGARHAIRNGNMNLEVTDRAFRNV